MLASLVSQLLVHDDAALKRSNPYSRQIATYAAHEPLLPLPTEEELRQGLRNGQFQSYFQPKFDLHSGAVRGLEVLARWEHPVLGTLAPSYFISQLMAHGLIDELLFQQLDESAILLRQLHGLGYRLNLSLNILPEQLSHEHLVSRFRSMLKRYALAGESLTLEVLESGLIGRLDDCLENCEQLRRLGCGLSMDDFGNGYSSLQRLCQLPFNEIKLDREFIRALEVDSRGQAIVTSTLALGNALNMPVVVEGVETWEQRNNLIALGCTMAQGFLCAQPMDRKTLLAWLPRRAPWA